MIISMHTAIPQVKPITAVVTGVLSSSVFLEFTITMDLPPVTEEDIQWSFVGVSGLPLYINASSRLSFSPDRLALAIPDLSYDDEGTYTLLATNLLGSGSASIFLDVQGG